MIRSLAILLCLAACSGGGGATPPVPPDMAYDRLFDEVTTPGTSNFAALPAAGAVDYSGRVRLNLPIGRYDGDLAVTVGFDAADDPLTGAIRNLVGASGTMTGSLQISDGVLYPDADARDYQFSANLAGTLAQGGQSYDLTGGLSGDFYGATGQGMAGVIYRGTIRQGDDVAVFDGSFVAERRRSDG